MHSHGAARLSNFRAVDFPILYGTLLVAATVAIHATGTMLLLAWLGRSPIFRKKRISHFMALRVLTATSVFLLLLHVIEVQLWAVVYLALPKIPQIPNFETASYFSFITYTTVGYGDITLDPPWRMMAGIEALNGILLAGWSTALLFTVVEKILDHRESSRERPN